MPCFVLLAVMAVVGGGLTHAQSHEFMSRASVYPLPYHFLKWTGPSEFPIRSGVHVEEKSDTEELKSESDKRHDMLKSRAAPAPAASASSLASIREFSSPPHDNTECLKAAVNQDLDNRCLRTGRTSIKADIVAPGRYEVMIPDSLINRDLLVTSARLIVYVPVGRVAMKVQLREDGAGGPWTDDFAVESLSSTCNVVDMIDFLAAERPLLMTFRPVFAPRMVRTKRRLLVEIDCGDQCGAAPLFWLTVIRKDGGCPFSA